MNEKQIKVRVETDLHAWLKSEAERNHRSMSAEITARLEQSQRIDEILTEGTARPGSHEATLAEQLAQAIREG